MKKLVILRVSYGASIPRHAHVGGRVSLCTFLQQTLADFDDKDLFVLL